MTGPAAPERQVTATGRGFAPVDGSVGGSAADAGRNALWGVSGLGVRYGHRVALDGVTLDDPDGDRFVPARTRAIGVVFQDRLLFDHMTVIQNVAFGSESRQRKVGGAKSGGKMDPSSG